jgi:aryl-alcohol dehydrogenase-like predicted oxidoreductase
MPGVDTVVIGVKNRAELRDCLTAENKGPLAPEIMQKLDAMLDADR